MDKKYVLVFGAIILLSAGFLFKEAYANNHESESIDKRQQISLNDKERAFVLGRMRNMLQTLTAMQQKLLVNEPAQIHEIVSYMNENHHDDRPRGLGKSLPAPGQDHEH